MAKFERAYELMLAREGGYVNDCDDPGGETYKGIARKKQSEWVGWQIIDRMKLQLNFPANMEGNQLLQQEIARFYKSMFWDKVGGDLVNNQELADLVFDFAVNAGVSASVGLAQKVVGSACDGVMGLMTIEAINRFDPDHFAAAFMVEKCRKYLSICKKRPESRKYFFGWIDRAVN
ncbi:MAG TPA: N-acetylmuramidase [Prolixibacteraceae bacterium]|nr:N-acetylmuramidase [Prolixibacteraceae bacterium]